MLLVAPTGGLDGCGTHIFRVLNTVTFAEAGAKTVLTLQAHVVEISDERAERHLPGMNQGWRQSLDELAALVKSGKEAP